VETGFPLRQTRRVCAEIILKQRDLEMATISHNVRGGRKEEAMRRICAVLSAIPAFVLWAAAPSHAAPPTVTPSPGYDARLQESRAASRMTVHEPVVPAIKPEPRRTKRTYRR
jgi:hypothetical protein